MLQFQTGVQDVPEILMSNVLIQALVMGYQPTAGKSIDVQWGEEFIF